MPKSIFWRNEIGAFWRYFKQYFGTAGNKNLMRLNMLKTMAFHGAFWRFFETCDGWLKGKCGAHRVPFGSASANGRHEKLKLLKRERNQKEEICNLYQDSNMYKIIKHIPLFYQKKCYETPFRSGVNGLSSCLLLRYIPLSVAGLFNQYNWLTN